MQLIPWFRICTKRNSALYCLKFPNASYITDLEKSVNAAVSENLKLNITVKTHLMENYPSRKGYG